MADSYDAMTSERPYRKKMPQQDAIQELYKNRGKQFDPEVVDIFLKTLGIKNHEELGKSKS